MIKRVLVKKLNVLAYMGDFKTIEEANAWIDSNKNTNAWGRDIRWAKEGSLEMVNEIPELAIETEEREDLETGESFTWYKFEAEYTVEIEDTIDIMESANAKQYLADTDWYIIRELDSGEPCPQEIKDARALARTKVIN